MYPYDSQLSVAQDQLAKLMTPQNQPIHVVKVNGRAGAETYNLPPNSDIILLDLNDPIVWFVQSDGAGYKTVTPYSIAPYKEITQADIVKSLEDRIAKLEEEVRNGRSVSANSKPNHPATNGQQHAKQQG